MNGDDVEMLLTSAPHMQVSSSSLSNILCLQEWDTSEHPMKRGDGAIPHLSRPAAEAAKNAVLCNSRVEGSDFQTGGCNPYSGPACMTGGTQIMFPPSSYVWQMVILLLTTL